MSLRPMSGDTCDGPSRVDCAESPAPASGQSNDILVGDFHIEEASETIPRPNRNACMLCRKRKLRCDGGQPSCGTCIRLSHVCNYIESRRKSGPKRGYVKTLETRLAQVEALLKKQDTAASSTVTTADDLAHELNSLAYPQHPEFDITDVTNDPVMKKLNLFPDITQSQAHTHLFSQIPEDEIYGIGPNEPFDSMSWALIGLGVEEPLPLQETIEDLNDLYFNKVHPSYPMINEYRFRAEMILSPHTRPSVALRYAMWANAASTTEKYKDLHTYFYARARKYAEADEMTGRHRYINVRHAQAWLLICIYEFKMMHFPHAWLTTGRATRLTQMMGLHRLDGVGMDVKQTIPESGDWSEKEERRRTFWMTFCKDRHASIGTGWPMIIDERDITTNMPSSEEAYARNEETTGISLIEAMKPQSASSLSAFAGVVIIAALSGRTLLHLQRPSTKNDDHDLNGEFWKAHRKIDNILLNTSLYLPSHLRLPAGSSNANIIFLNMGIQAAIIVVHQAAIFKAEKFRLDSSIVAESSIRCIAAATQITSIMRIIAHTDLSVLNTHTTFVLFLATRIFAQAAKKDPDNDNARSSAHFLFSALIAMKKTIPIAEIYIVQLDLEGFRLAEFEENVQASGLENSVANISIKDDTSDPSWVKYISPLVRIVEQSDDSKSTSKSLPSAGNDYEIGETFTSPENTSKNTESTISTSGGSEILESGGYFEEGQSFMPEIPEFMDEFAGTETWGLDDQNMSTDLFDTLMDMEPSSWSAGG